MFREFLAVALLFLSSETFAQNLEAVLSNTRLPVPIQGMPVLYDGQDSIYVLGGFGTDNSYQKDILKFSVRAETIEMVGTMDPVAFGSAVWTGNENILYLGGIMAGTESYQSKVWDYKPDGASGWTRVGDLPSDAGETSGVWDQGEYSYIFGGSYRSGVLNTISRYSSVTNSSVVVGELPSPRDYTSAVWDETTGDAYVFGGYGSNRLNDIVKFNPAENTVVTLSVTLPKAPWSSCAIWTGTEAYIIGGRINSPNISCFIPSTNQVLDISVNNLPPNFYGHGCAFVKKLNRIYVFGGELIGDVIGDEIRYIDLGLSPTNPTTTTPITTTTTTATTTPITTTTTTKATTTPITTPTNPTTTTPITTTTKEPNNEVGRTRFPDQFCWLLALFVCFHL